MTRSLTALLLSTALIACTAQEAETPAETVEAPVETTTETAPAAPEAVSLTEVWVTDGFDSPESVIPTADGSAYYVSVVGGEGRVEDNNGAIAKIGLDGSVIERDWVTGTDAVPLHAPKGMTLVENEKGMALLATDIDHVAFILVDEGRLAKRLPAPGAGFLNDIEKGPGETAFISDSANARIYKLENDEITVWLEDERLGGVNGLLMHDGQLLVSTMSAGELLSIDPDTKVITGLAAGMENADGIGVRSDGSYMLSSWPGQLWHVRAGEAPTLVLDTRAETVGEANMVLMNDVLFLEDTVIAPNWMPGTVRAYSIQ